jgi:hypothetical protein
MSEICGILRTAGEPFRCVLADDRLVASNLVAAGEGDGMCASLEVDMDLDVSHDRSAPMSV